MTGRTYRNAGVDQVRALVEKEIKGTIGMEAVNGIDIAIISHSTVIQMPTKTSNFVCFTSRVIYCRVFIAFRNSLYSTSDNKRVKFVRPK